MTDEQSKPLISALSQFRGWAEWFDFLDEAISKSTMPSGTTTASMLNRFLDVPGSKGMALLRILRDRFAIERLKRRNTFAFPVHGQGWVRITNANDAVSLPVVQLAVGDAPATRQISVELHEVGHLFYATLIERHSPLTQDHRKRTDNAERFCWEFAKEILCPQEERATWNLEFLSTLLRSSEKELAQRLGPKEVQRLTFFHLREIARRYRMSIRMVIAMLDRHPLLSEIEIGMVIFRRMPNPKTSEDTDIRAWMRARPNWGFVVLNQRAVKQGFTGVRSVFERGESQEPVCAEETLELRCLFPNAKVKWQPRAIATTCVYTPVDVDGEGRYVVAVWHWPRPEA